MTTTRLDDVLASIDDGVATDLDGLFTLVRQPSISAQNVGVRDCAELVRGFMDDAGLETRLLETSGHPMVLGTWLEAGEYEDVPGFCKAASLDEVRAHGHVLTPGRYVGAEAVATDGEPFGEKMERLTERLTLQFAESARLEAMIQASIKTLRTSKSRTENADQHATTA